MPLWLNDNRRLLFEGEGKVYLVDSQSKKSHEIFSLQPHSIFYPTPSRDNRLIYFTLQTTEADIWMAAMP